MATSIENLVDILSNSMELYDEEDFALYVRELKCTNAAEVYAKYWGLSPSKKSEVTFDWIDWIDENVKFEEEYETDTIQPFEFKNKEPNLSLIVVSKNGTKRKSKKVKEEATLILDSGDYIEVSLFKGWGESYTKRDIESIEIKIFDEILFKGSREELYNLLKTTTNENK